MPATVHEKPIAQSGSTEIENGPKGCRRIFCVRGASTFADAETAFASAIGSTVPTTSNGLPLVDWDFEELGGGAWDYTVTYGRTTIGGSGPGERRVRFAIGGGQQLVKISKETIAVFQDASSTGFEIGTFGSAIGIGSDGAAEGCQIPVPSLEFEVIKNFAEEDITNEYVSTLAELTGTTNNATFNGYAAGELLFLGAAGDQYDTGDYQVTFRFAVSKNRTDLVVGQFENIVKKGWHYLWVLYRKQEVEVDDAKYHVDVPQAVYIERVFDEADFTELDSGEGS